jgi:hypothetical protein
MTTIEWHSYYHSGVLSAVWHAMSDDSPLCGTELDPEKVLWATSDQKLPGRRADTVITICRECLKSFLFHSSYS